MKALVIFSGGQDSTTCLGWAISRYDEVIAVTFSYNQKHKVAENQAASYICQKLDIPLHKIELDFMSRITDSALTSNGDVNKKHDRIKNLPASFVPNRNALFITLAHTFAQKMGCEAMVGGMCETDFSGYPDCRSKFITQLINTLNQGSESQIVMRTPLMSLTKAETFKLAETEGILDLVLYVSHTCYNGSGTMNDWGKGCGECPACKLRKKGWEEYTKMK